MSETLPQMRTIWYFVGLILLVIGGMIFVTGIYHLFEPDSRNTVLRHLHPELWWSGFMLLAGLLFIWIDRRQRIA